LGITDDEYSLLKVFAEQSVSTKIKDVATEGSIYDANYAVAQAQKELKARGVDAEDISDQEVMEVANKCTYF